MDPSPFSVILATLRSAKDSCASLLDPDQEPRVREHAQQALELLGSLQHAMLEIREELFESRVRIRELETRVASTEDWQSQMEKYRVVRTAGGAVVYQAAFEPGHYVCPSCLNQRKIEILQDRRVMSGDFACPACKARFPIGENREPPGVSWTIE